MHSMCPNLHTHTLFELTVVAPAWPALSPGYLGGAVPAISAVAAVAVAGGVPAAASGGVSVGCAVGTICGGVVGGAGAIRARGGGRVAGGCGRVVAPEVGGVRGTRSSRDNGNRGNNASNNHHSCNGCHIQSNADACISLLLVPCALQGLAGQYEGRRIADEWDTAECCKCQHHYGEYIGDLGYRSELLPHGLL